MLRCQSPFHPELELELSLSSELATDIPDLLHSCPAVGEVPTSHGNRIRAMRCLWSKCWSQSRQSESMAGEQGAKAAPCFYSERPPASPPPLMRRILQLWSVPTAQRKLTALKFRSNAFLRFLFLPTYLTAGRYHSGLLCNEGVGRVDWFVEILQGGQPI